MKNFSKAVEPFRRFLPEDGSTTIGGPGDFNRTIGKMAALQKGGRTHFISGHLNTMGAPRFYAFQQFAEHMGSTGNKHIDAVVAKVREFAGWRSMSRDIGLYGEKLRAGSPEIYTYASDARGAMNDTMNASAEKTDTSSPPTPPRTERRFSVS